MVSLERENSLDPVIDEYRIKELQEESVRIQGKTFTKWINLHLSEEGTGMVDLFVDIRDGVRLFRLLEILSGDSIGKPKLARSRFHMIDNVNKCLDYLRTKIRIESIGANDIVAGNERLILGLIWTVIKCFQLRGVAPSENSKEGGTEKDHLLFWCQKQFEGYADVHVHDFSASWRDGVAFNTLIHSRRPDLIDLANLHPDRHIENLNNAFDAAFQHLGIAKLLDPEDVDKDKPDEISIITYISLFYIAFANSVRQQRTIPRAAESTTPVRPASLNTNNPPPSPTGGKSPPPVVAPRQRVSITSPTSPISPPATPTRAYVSSTAALPSSGGTAPEVMAPRGQAIEAGVKAFTGNERLVADLIESTKVLVYDNSQMEGSWECNYCSFVNVPFTQLCAICFQNKKVVDQLNRKRSDVNAEVSSTVTTTKTADNGTTRSTTVVTRITKSSVQDTTKQLLEETDCAEKQKVAVDRLGKLLNKMKHPPPSLPSSATPPAVISSKWSCPSCNFENVPHTLTCAHCFGTRPGQPPGQQGSSTVDLTPAPSSSVIRMTTTDNVHKLDEDESESDSDLTKSTD